MKKFSAIPPIFLTVKEVMISKGVLLGDNLI